MTAMTKAMYDFLQPYRLRAVEVNWPPNKTPQHALMLQAQAKGWLSAPPVRKGVVRAQVTDAGLEAIEQYEGAK